ncbi:hypothetical protein RISW2_21825 [Roseivivax isoporae LMG 25204]|uniref:Uncharacterized protein n=2 Tax=Roseivivax TaxID=93682 RepID=X7F3J6_9RHOB|nr:hypothetical protein RISW2_21825 [Roseivivax isoporae LMG 25204]
MKTLNPSQVAGVVGVIDPDANAAATYTTGWIAIGDWRSLMAIVMAGSLGTSATIDAKLEQAQDATGTGVKDVPNSAITQLTQAGTDSDKQAIIECWGEDLDLVEGFTHVRLSMTVAAATSDCGAIVLGFDPRYGPASERDAATVAEIVTV